MENIDSSGNSNTSSMYEQHYKNLKEKIETVMKRAYWDKLKEDIENNNFDSTLKILEEIRDRFCLITPNRPDIQAEIHENIDIKFIDQKIKHNAMEPQDIQNIILFIVKKITDYGTLADEQWNEIWKTQIEVFFNRKEPLSEIFPKFFKEALHRLAKIENEIESFKQSELYKEIVRKRKEKEELEKKS